MNVALLEKITTFDKNGKFKTEIDKAMILLQEFRKKYPFVEKPELIDNLTPNDIFTDSGEVGEFFLWIEYRLKPLGYLYLFSSVYHNIRNQLDDFKELLYTVVDQNKSIAEKVNAEWETIPRMGDDKHIAKKIIFCFNHQNNSILPIFKTTDLEYFYRNVTDTLSFPSLYSSKNMGEKYQFLNSEVIKNKMNIPETRSWELAYFSRFLYETIPPPRGILTYVTSEERKKEKENQKQQKDYGAFVALLNQLRRNDEISAVERRNYEKNWRHQPESRTLMLHELERKMKKSGR